MVKKNKQRSRIFIVDDDKDFAESVAEALELNGFNVDVAHSGEDAIAKIKKYNYDFTFMDIKLPGKNGVESFLEMQHSRPDIKVIMMTGYSIENLLNDAIKNGAYAILYKPLNMNEILGMIKKPQAI